LKEIPLRYRWERNTHRNMIIHSMIKKTKNIRTIAYQAGFIIPLLKNYNDMTMKLMRNVYFILSIINAGFITDMNNDIKW
jgi:hypothetical protein